jgi:hypothetical protein
MGGTNVIFEKTADTVHFVHRTVRFFHVADFTRVRGKWLRHAEPAKTRIEIISTTVVAQQISNTFPFANPVREYRELALSSSA